MPKILFLDWRYKLLLLSLFVCVKLSVEREVECLVNVDIDDHNFVNNEFFSLVGLRKSVDVRWEIFVTYKGKVVYAEIPFLIYKDLDIKVARLFLIDHNTFYIVYKVEPDSDVIEIVEYVVEEENNKLQLTLKKNSQAFLKTKPIHIADSMKGLYDSKKCIYLKTLEKFDCRCSISQREQDFYCVYDRVLDRYHKVQYLDDDRLIFAHYCNYFFEGKESGFGSTTYFSNKANWSDYNEVACFNSFKHVYKQLQVVDINWPARGKKCKDLILKKFVHSVVRKPRPQIIPPIPNIYKLDFEEQKIRVPVLGKCLKSPFFIAINLANLVMFIVIILLVVFSQLGVQRKAKLIGIKRRKWYNHRLRKWPKKKRRSKERKRNKAFTKRSKSSFFSKVWP